MTAADVFSSAGTVQVDWLLAATVYSDTENVRVLVQLIELPSRRYLWSLSLQGKFASALEAQRTLPRAAFSELTRAPNAPREADRHS